MSDNLTANITASRNPVLTNKPSLSTSELTCNVNGLLDKEDTRYNKYITTNWGSIDFSSYPPIFKYADGTTWCDTDRVYSSRVNSSASADNAYVVDNSLFIDTGEVLVKEYPKDDYPYKSASDNEHLEIKFKLKVADFGTANNYGITCIPLFVQPYYKGGSYNHLGYFLWKLDNSKYTIRGHDFKDNLARYPITDDFDLDLDDWIDVRIVIYKYGDTYYNYDGIAKLYVNNNYIAFREDPNHVSTDTVSTSTMLNGTDLRVSSANGPTYAEVRTYWHYHFCALRGKLYFKDYSINTLTVNPDYEEYPELTYQWDTNETTQSITVKPLEPTTYTCTVTQADRTTNASILIDTQKAHNDLPIADIKYTSILTLPKSPKAIIKGRNNA